MHSSKTATNLLPNLRQTFQLNIYPEITTINNNDIEAEEQTSTIRKTAKSEIKRKLISTNKTNKTPGFNLITGKVVKELKGYQIHNNII